MEITVTRGDITTADADAIVNAANSSLMGGGGVDGAIHRAAGPMLLDACRRVREQQYPDGFPRGKAVATPAGDLKAAWVIHTVGPVYSERRDLSDVLTSCYRESLREARRVGAHSVAFPAISAGVYGWPMDDATRIAVETVRLMEDEVGSDIDEVTFYAFDERAAAAFGEALEAGVEKRSEPENGNQPLPRTEGADRGTSG